MRYLSLFSGIEACSVAWKPLGWECVGVAEIEPFPRRVLAHHYPNVPNLGDVTKVTEADIAALGQIDLVVFGSPCQDLSVAGKRKGLAGVRSGLFFTAINIIQWARLWGGCRLALWENVPGAFSSNNGADFAAVVDALAGLDGTEVPPKGWGTEGCALGAEAMVEWSTLDAQWFGVAQRRRRVFALADFGNWRDRPPILLESESLRGDSPPRRQTGEDTAGGSALSVALRGREGGGTAELGGACAGTLRASGEGGDKPHVLIGLQRPVLSSSGDVSHCPNAGGTGRIDYETETMIVQGYDILGVPATRGAAETCVHTPLRARTPGRSEASTTTVIVCTTGDVTHTLKAEGFDASEDGTGRGTPIIAFNSNVQPDEMRFDPHLSAPLTCSQNSAVLTSEPAEGVSSAGLHGEVPREGVLQQARAAGAQGNTWPATNEQVRGVPGSMAVRRLLPVECERLQAFPDGYTAVPTNGKPAADGPRYKALGNSMCVNVMRWIGHQVDSAVRFW